MDIELQGQKRSFTLDKFEGPLDLLLHLVRESSISIYDIPIASITDQFCTYLKQMEKSDLGDLTEFYLMATTLLLIKSRLLLPMEVTLDEELEDPRHELIEKLIEHHKFRKYAELLEERELDIELEHLKRTGKRSLPELSQEEVENEVLDIQELIDSIISVVSGIAPERVVYLHEEVTISGKLTLIYELAETRREFTFESLLPGRVTQFDVVCALIALLSVAKEGRVTLLQEENFGCIRIVTVERGHNSDDGAI